LDGRVHVDGELIADSTNSYLLLEGVFIYPIGEQSEIPFPGYYLGAASRIVSNISVGNIFDVPDYSSIDFRQIIVSFIINWDGFARRAILPLVVGNLLDVLREFVDC
jgi:hypothetical protein